ncbi:MAG: DUF1638 domain-containing protein [Desulfobacula sp.]|nr:DUF1638 domain-containing protein [Desulfobacula sp.]
MHVNFKKLQTKLEKGLKERGELPTIVFYGACHPLMEKVLLRWKAIRTPGQNCVEILLGHDLFTEEIEKGAFFLMEDWARRFKYVTGLAFNDNIEVTREIFQMGHNYMLGIRTPLSQSFVKDAEKASQMVDLPLHWMDITLDHLEKRMEQAIEQRKNEL